MCIVAVGGLRFNVFVHHIHCGKLPNLLAPRLLSWHFCRIRLQFLLGDGLVVAKKAIPLAVRLGAPLYANDITLTTQAVFEDVRKSIQHFLYAAFYCRNYPPNSYNLPCSAQTLLRNVPHTSDNPVFLTKSIPSNYLHHTLHGITTVFSCHRT